MSLGWFLFGVAMPVTVAAVGWIAVLANERHLRAKDRRRAGPAE